MAVDMGTDGDDFIYGTIFSDSLYGLGGSDVLSGGPGDDYLDGDGGDDFISGDLGDDTLVGGGGNDVMHGGIGNDLYLVDAFGDVLVENQGEGIDTVRTPRASYTLAGDFEILQYAGYIGAHAFMGAGNALDNTIDTRTADSNDTLRGMAGADTLYAGAGNDSLDGGSGADAMYGATGDDIYFVDDAADQAIEFSGEGHDIVRSTAADYTLGGGIETLVLTGTGKNGTGNALDNVLIGTGGHNMLDGGVGADRMEGGLGDDVYRIDNANDVIVEAGGIDKAIAGVSYKLRAGVSIETLTTDNDAGTTAINLTGNELANRVVGNAGANTLHGGSGNDRLEGLDGSDTLWGDAGTDLLIGGNDNDLYVVTDSDDTIVETATGGADRVSLSLATGGIFTLANYVETLVVAGAGIEAHGNALDNKIVNSATGSSLWGEGGNDRLIGATAADELHGGIGNDRLEGAAGNDVLWGDAGNDVFVFAAGTGADEVVDFTRGADRVDLTACGVSSFAQLQGMLLQSGADAVVDLGGGNSIALDNVVAAQLAASDFVFAPAAPGLADTHGTDTLLPLLWGGGASLAALMDF